MTLPNDLKQLGAESSAEGQSKATEASAASAPPAPAAGAVAASVGVDAIAASAASKPEAQDAGVMTTGDDVECTMCAKIIAKDSAVKASLRTYKCKPCNVSKVTAARCFGGHLPEEFDIMAGRPCVVCTELSKQITTSTLRSRGGSYQPLGYYEKIGYDVERIERLCKDVREHPLLGTTYKVEIDSEAQEQRQARIMTRLMSKARMGNAVARLMYTCMHGQSSCQKHGQDGCQDAGRRQGRQPWAKGCQRQDIADMHACT